MIVLIPVLQLNLLCTILSFIKIKFFKKIEFSRLKILYTFYEWFLIHW